MLTEQLLTGDCEQLLEQPRTVISRTLVRVPGIVAPKSPFPRIRDQGWVDVVSGVLDMISADIIFQTDVS